MLHSSEAVVTNLPSNLQPYQVAVIYFGFGVPIQCRVSKVSFTMHGEVYYDVEVYLVGDQKARLHGIHSAFVLDPNSQRVKDAGTRQSQQKFTEDDLVKFAHFVLSDQRKEARVKEYIGNEAAIAEERTQEGYLKAVWQADLNEWHEQVLTQFPGN